MAYTVPSNEEQVSLVRTIKLTSVSFNHRANADTRIRKITHTLVHYTHAYGNVRVRWHTVNISGPESKAVQNYNRKTSNAHANAHHRVQR